MTNCCRKAVTCCPRILQVRDALVAQWIERRTSNPKVAGSNPAGRTQIVDSQQTRTLTSRNTISRNFAPRPAGPGSSANKPLTSDSRFEPEWATR